MIGLALFMPKTQPQDNLRFSWAWLRRAGDGLWRCNCSIAVIAELDWFVAREILVEAVIAGTGFYLFIVHMVTFGPSVPARVVLFTDRNVSSGMVMAFCVSSVMLASARTCSGRICRESRRASADTAWWAMALRGASASWLPCSSPRDWGDERWTSARSWRLVWSCSARRCSKCAHWTPDISGIPRWCWTLVLQGFARWDWCSTFCR